MVCASLLLCRFLFFFKQKTAYEMRISDWSSDVCSSDLMQKDQGFGTSQFVESARYQHALETELARTIGNLQQVRGARIHLAIPKPSAFAIGRASWKERECKYV